MELISASIGAAVALFVFGAGHWVTWKRDQTQKLSQKLETLYSKLDDLHQAAIPPSYRSSMDDLDYESVIGVKVGEIHRRIAEIEMLAVLYFPSAAQRVHEIALHGGKVIDQLLEDENIEESVNASEALWDSILELKVYLSSEVDFLIQRGWRYLLS